MDAGKLSGKRTGSRNLSGIGIISMTQSFIEKLTQTLEQNDSLLCVGLDPNPHQYPDCFTDFQHAPTTSLVAWGKNIIDQTADLVCCYKPNFAFYEQFGPAGLDALQQTIAAIPDGIPVLLDAKRGDIGHTAAAYAEAAFNVWGADAITVSPYLGEDGVSPFLEFPGKAVFVLCYTSNPSAKQIQEYSIAQLPLFEHVAQQASHWGSAEQVAFVVGATQPHALTRMRQIAPDRWFLAPGIGVQGGSLPLAVAAGLNQHGHGLIVPCSRAINYAENPRAIALGLREAINQIRRQPATQETAPVGHPQQLLIKKLYDVGCVQFGDFVLASGQASPIYFDLRRIMADPILLKLVAKTYADMLTPYTFDHVAGVPYAALPLGTAVAMTLDKSLIYPRKEAKAYGLGKSVEGCFAEGDTVVVIEDLVTSGGSALKAIEQLEAAKLNVACTVVLIDREQGGGDTFEGAGYPLHAALKLSEMLTVLHDLKEISEDDFHQVKDYLRQGQTIS